MTPPIILAFDTSGPHCATALVRGDAVLAHRLEAMAKGQAERLMPLIQETLAEAQIAARDLSAIGVGIGPGNFTGIRIAVSAARGLALALGIPAIGISTFEALYGNRDHILPTLVALPAPRGAAYVQRMSPKATPPMVIDTPDALAPFDLLVAQDRDTLPEWLRHMGSSFGVGAPIAISIARRAGGRIGTPQPRPAPLYIKPADAAPSREQGPLIL